MSGARVWVRTASHCAGGLALIVWWAPTLLLAMASAAAFAWGVSYRLRRAHRLLDAGRPCEAVRVYAALKRDVGAAGRKGRVRESER